MEDELVILNFLYSLIMFILVACMLLFSKGTRDNELIKIEENNIGNLFYDPDSGVVYYSESIGNELSSKVEDDEIILKILYGSRYKSPE